TGSSATISTTTGTITVSPTAGRQAWFAQSGSGTTTLNLNGGAVAINTGSAKIDTGVTLASNRTVSATLGSGTLILNGTVQSTNDITFNGTTNLTVTGTGTTSSGGSTGTSFKALSGTLSFPSGSQTMTGLGVLSGNTVSVTNGVAVTSSGNM